MARNGHNGGGEEHSKRASAQSSPPSRSRAEKKPKKFRVSKKTLIMGEIVLGVLVIAGILFWLHARRFESTDDAYTTAHVHDISARVAGTIEHVNVEDNQVVKTGQPLVVLDQRDFKVALEQARAQLLQKKAVADQAQANLTHAQQDYDRFTQLGQQQVVSKQEVDNAAANLKTATGAMAAAKADLAAAQAAVDTSALQLSYTTIFAPADGVIGKKTAETGARVQPGQPLMAVVEQNVWVLANFKETQLAHMRIGQHVDVAIDALPKQKFSAHVDSFQPGTGSTFALLPPDNATGNFTKIVQRVPVKIVFDEPDNVRKAIVPGMSCKPRVDVRSNEKK
jgi:membrane fusion protein (multidrug efflux system)